MFALVAFIIAIILLSVLFSKFSKTFNRSITNIASVTEKSTNALNEIVTQMEDSAKIAGAESKLEKLRWIRDHQQEIDELSQIDAQSIFEKLANK